MSLPIYEYRCTNGHHFEVNQSMSDDPVTKCQQCRSKVQRVLYAPAIHFKGTGFHNTDYGTKKRPKDGGDSSTTSTTTTADTTSTTGGEGSTGGDTAAPKVKEATPAATAARTTGP